MAIMIRILMINIDLNFYIVSMRGIDVEYGPDAMHSNKTKKVGVVARSVSYAATTAEIQFSNYIVTDVTCKMVDVIIERSDD